MDFKLHSDYQPTDDRPQAIEALVKGFREGNQFQTLLGVTGSSTQTFSIQDIRFFIEFSALEVMVVVSNQGAVNYLRREANYDLKKAIALFNECVEDLKKILR